VVDLTTRGFRAGSRTESGNNLKQLQQFMKPTPQINSDRRERRQDGGALRDHSHAPSTDYNFQSTVAEVGSVATGEKTMSEVRTFRQLSTEFLGAEANRDYAAELAFFTLIAGIAAWPVMSMLTCLAWMQLVHPSLPV
jgi:hypothetical protein